MSNLSIEFFSNSLMRPVTFKLVIPNDPREYTPKAEGKYAERKMKLLFLLHGYTGSGFNWVPEDLPYKYNFAIVIPNGENGFWVDSPSSTARYATLLGVEIPKYLKDTFGFSLTPEDTYILGFSMGGYGALHTALAYPDVFGKVGAMSSALIIHDLKKFRSGEAEGICNKEYYECCFGDLDRAEDSDYNPEVLALKLKESNKKIPGIYMCCGTEDFLLENNRVTDRFFTANEIPHIYKESKGIHDMVFWAEYTEKIIEWMFG